MSDNIQLSHADHGRTDTKYPLCILANDVSSPLNVGGLFRLSDALGIERLYLCGNTPSPPNGKITKTSRSTEKHVDYEIHENAESLVTSLKASGTIIVSLEITSSSVDINSIEFKTHISGGRPICLILGSELSGVNEDLLSLSDLTVHIPMLGNNSSMNVITATSIACFEITKRLIQRT